MKNTFCHVLLSLCPLSKSTSLKVSLLSLVPLPSWEYSCLWHLYPPKDANLWDATMALGAMGRLTLTHSGHTPCVSHVSQSPHGNKSFGSCPLFHYSAPHRKLCSHIFIPFPPIYLIQWNRSSFLCASNLPRGQVQMHLNPGASIAQVQTGAFDENEFWASVDIRKYKCASLLLQKIQNTY